MKLEIIFIGVGLLILAVLLLTILRKKAITKSEPLFKSVMMERLWGMLLGVCTTVMLLPTLQELNQIIPLQEIGFIGCILLLGLALIIAELGLVKNHPNYQHLKIIIALSVFCGLGGMIHGMIKTDYILVIIWFIWLILSGTYYYINCKK
ncbi:MAG: hypothetical protein K8R25_06000 [Methanosarcinales archaeon]|nr:hypothetical protein [Methanosarcinales archaeon]